MRGSRYVLWVHTDRFYTYPVYHLELFYWDWFYHANSSDKHREIYHKNPQKYMYPLYGKKMAEILLNVVILDQSLAYLITYCQIGLV